MLCCVFHPTQLLLATGGDDSQVRVWDLVAKTCVATLQAHFSAVTSLAISPDGWTLLSGGRDGVVVGWSLRDYSKIATVPVYEAVEGIVALPAAACGLPGSPLCFATGGEKGVTKLWRADTGKCIFDIPPAEAGPPTAAGGIVELRAMPRGSGLLAATQDCRLLFLRTSGDGKLTLDRQLIGNNDEVTDLRFIAAPQGESSGPSAATHGASSGVTAGKAPAPTHVAVATNAEHIRLFDTATLSCAVTLAGHTEAVLSLDALRLKSGQTLLGSGSKDNTVRVWCPFPDGRCIGVGTGHVGAVSAVAFARKGGGFLVSGGADKLLKIWDVASLSLDSSKPAVLKATAAVAAHTKDINAVAVAPNDSVVASASQDRTVKIWQLPSLVPVMTLKGHKRGVWAVAFSPVDKALATASGDKTMKLWSLADGSCLRTFEGHLASVLRVDFLSSGTQLLSAGGDGLLKLWNLRTLECINTFDAHEDKVWALAMGGSSGEIVASGGADGGVVIWEDCTVSDLQDAARDQQATLLQEQQLSNAMHSRDWKKAASLAFEMRHPGKLLTVVNAAFQGDQATGEAILRSVVEDLDAERLRQCLEYCREWNTNGRTCFAAQAMLGAVLRMHSPATLAAIPGVAGVLEAIEAYTRRHFARTDRLLRSTYLADFILQSMNVLLPENDHVANGDVAMIEAQDGAGDAVHAVPNGHAAHDSESESDEEQEEEEEVEVVTEKKKNKKSSSDSKQGVKTRQKVAAEQPKSAKKKRKSSRE